MATNKNSKLVTKKAKPKVGKATISASSLKKQVAKLKKAKKSKVAKDAPLRAKLSMKRPTLNPGLLSR